MKRLLLVFSFILALQAIVFATTPDRTQVCTLDATTTTCALQDQTNAGIAFHRITWSLVGTNSGSTVLLQKSAKPITSYSTVITGTSTSSNYSDITAGSAPVWRISLSGFTATSVGAQVTVTYTGYVANPEVSLSGVTLGAVTIADGGAATLGTTTEDKCTATNTTSETVLCLTKGILYTLQQGLSSANITTTGSAVPASAGYIGINVAGNLRGPTGTNTSGSVYAIDTNVAALPSITYNATQPTKTDGQTVSDFQITSRGALIVATGVEGVVPGSSATIGGLTPYNLEAAGSDNHANIKNGAGQVYFIHITNTHTAVQYVRLYNAATGFNGCNSATNLIFESAVPADATGNGFTVSIPQGETFSTGISICYTGAFGNTDTTSATASKSIIHIGYK